MKSKEPNIVVIGGGTGSFTLLIGLKNYTSSIKALVNMADDGGSSGVLRDELGVLPPGDVRQCLVALSSTPKVRELFSYRFDEGSLKGHTFGNLFISAVEKMTNSFDSAVELAGEVLHIQGEVIPVTSHDTHLIMERPDGSKLRGEHKIGSLDFHGANRPKLRLEPAATLHPKAKKAIMDADIVVIAPGNLYGSLAPALLVGGMKEALVSTHATVVYVCNLVTKPGQTDNFYVHDFVNEIERFVGAKIIDHVLFNTDEPPKATLERYTHDNEFIVGFDLDVMSSKHYQPIGLPLISKDSGKKGSPHDSVGHIRTLIRHDSDKVAREIMKIFFQ